MTLEQQLEIQEILKNNREKKGVTQEQQMEELIGNLFESYAEYYKAKNDEEKIKALCGIYLCCMNAFLLDTKNVKKR